MSPVVSPDGSKLLWARYGGLMLAQLNADGSLSHPRHIGGAGNKFAWLDNYHIVSVEDNSIEKINIHNPYTNFGSFSSYSSFSSPDHIELRPYLENAALENQRRFGELRFADVMPQGCILLIQNGVYGQTDELWRWCEDTQVDIWPMPEDISVIDATVSEAGQIAVNVWQAGFADLALFDASSGTLDYLTIDAGQDLDPVWSGEDSLLFRSDRHRDVQRDIQKDTGQGNSGVFDLYRLDISGATAISLTRLTQTLGGAFTPYAYKDQIWYSTLGNKGYDIAMLKSSEALTETVVPVKAVLPELAIEIPDYEVRGYEAGSSLLPFALLPEFLSVDPFYTELNNINSISNRIGVVLQGRGRAGKHNYNIGTGYQFAEDLQEEDDTYFYSSDTEDFQPHWYSYLNYYYQDVFRNGSKEDYYNSFEFRFKQEHTTDLSVITMNSKTIDITDSFSVSPNLRSVFAWANNHKLIVSDEQSSRVEELGSRFVVNLIPSLAATYRTRVADTKISMYSNFGVDYVLQNS